ncbi:hypothetical protein [Prolixibacter denitrificans]|uniref:Secreted protein (Por secretion system target) n=1 Tax=Prolixibacter denitrificans TaxID=1541063 RepID=A0A2P8CLB8_9BACT|nr:hypothetical protein [Prolixibacter denitrificans]PSK85769.1 hypothetical protein CLV93_101740 [Prolixibacter denitrificans]GET20389.1 hypothetical protein JCM18694_06350 [Prolixibacter denitrificans]
MKTTNFKTMMSKNLMVVSLSAFFLVITIGQALASGKTSVYTKDNSDLSIVSVINPGTQPMSITIENDLGSVVYYTKNNVSGSQYFKAFDFSKLDDGNYNLRVRSGNKTLVQSFNVVDGHANMNDQIADNKDVAPTFRFKNNMLKLSYLNLSKDNVEVYLYDNSNNLLHEENLGKDVSLGRIFDFESAKPGQYQVVLTVGDKNNYTYTVNK